MGRLINAIVAVNHDVLGIRQDSNVVVGVRVASLSLALRAEEQARCLFARLLGLLGTGPWALQACQVRPVAHGATRATERLGSGMTRSRWYKRPSRPWSALQRGQFRR